MKRIIVGLVIILSFFLLTGCSSSEKKLDKVSFEIDGVKKTEKTSGKLETGEKWEKNRYTLDGMVVSIIRFEDRNMKKGIDYREDLKEKKINNITYKYSEEDVDGKRVFCQYYTQVDKDVYYISATYEKNDSNKEKFENLLKSVVVKK